MIKLKRQKLVTAYEFKLSFSRTLQKLPLGSLLDCICWAACKFRAMPIPDGNPYSLLPAPTFYPFPFPPPACVGV